MFTKLGTYLNSQPLRSAARFFTASGEEFVVMPAREYTLSTGIAAENLPVLDIFDTVEVEKEIEKEEKSEQLAHLPLEEEMGVDALPL